MTAENVTERLNSVRELLNQLGEGVFELANTHPDVFDDPQITVQSQLLPVRDRALLNLPEGIDLEIIDLPGLKSVQDRANLQVIQPFDNPAFF